MTKKRYWISWYSGGYEEEVTGDAPATNEVE